MLQWMGGSRQKIKASRRSTEKRQRQYFEQRKRQQQMHCNTSSGDNVDSFNKSTQQQKEKRSLDILSLLNMPTVSERCITCPYEVNPPMECHSKNLPAPSVTTDPFTSSEINTGAVPARTLLSQHVKNMLPKRVQIGESDLQDSNSVEHHDKLKQSNNASSYKFQELCVLGLCGDDKANGYQKLTKHEPHVAFSMEGLGNMRTETPAHSPSPPSRVMPDSRSFFPKAMTHLHKSKTCIDILDTHEIKMEHSFRDHGLQFRSKYLDSDYQSAGRFKAYIDRKEDLLSVNSIRPGSEGYQMDLSGEANDLVDVDRASSGFWDACSFIDGECFDQRVETHCKTGRYSGLYSSGKGRLKDNHLGEDPFSLTRSWQRSSGGFCNLASPDLYAQPQQPAGDYSFLTPDESKISRHEDNLAPLSYLLADVNSMSRASSSSSSVSGIGISDASFARKNGHRRYDNMIPRGHSKNLDATGTGNDWHHWLEGDVFPEESWEISSPLHPGTWSKKNQHHLHRSQYCSLLEEDPFAVTDFHLDQQVDCPVSFSKAKDDTFLEGSPPPLATSMDFHINFGSPPRPFVLAAASFTSFSPQPTSFCEDGLGFYESCLEHDKNVPSSGSSKISAKEFLDQEELSPQRKMSGNGNLCKIKKSDEKKVTYNKREKDMYVGRRLSEVNSENGGVADKAKDVNISEGISTEDDADESPASICVKTAEDVDVCDSDTSPLSHRKRKGMTSEGVTSSSSTKPSCQLMMLESYVIHKTITKRTRL